MVQMWEQCFWTKRTDIRLLLRPFHKLHVMSKELCVKREVGKEKIQKQEQLQLQSLLLTQHYPLEECYSNGDCKSPKLKSDDLSKVRERDYANPAQTARGTTRIFRSHSSNHTLTLLKRDSSSAVANGFMLHFKLQSRILKPSKH